jgi:penicillin amidase
MLARLFDMPVLELPGDHDMPRVQDGAFGASERFAVSPGHEAQGYLHIAGGQSGHPLSPYYRAGFGAWARANRCPFFPDLCNTACCCSRKRDSLHPTARGCAV